MDSDLFDQIRLNSDCHLASRIRSDSNLLAQATEEKDVDELSEQHRATATSFLLLLFTIWILMGKSSGMRQKHKGPKIYRVFGEAEEKEERSAVLGIHLPSPPLFPPLRHLFLNLIL